MNGYSLSTQVTDAQLVAAISQRDAELGRQVQARLRELRLRCVIRAALPPALDLTPAGEKGGAEAMAKKKGKKKKSSFLLW